MANNNVVRKVRDGLVIAAAILMIATVVFQWMEIAKFELQDVITSRMSALFASQEAPAAPAAPADGAPAPDMAPMPGMGPDMAPPPGPPAPGL